MVLVKTPAGQEALKDRRGSLSSRQRSAFILFDGKRTTGEILAATAAMGITQDDVQAMIAQGGWADACGSSQPGGRPRHPCLGRGSCHRSGHRGVAG